MTSPAGTAVLLKGWEVAGITEAVGNGISGLPSLDPFHNIDPLSFTTVAPLQWNPPCRGEGTYH